MFFYFYMKNCSLKSHFKVTITLHKTTFSKIDCSQVVDYLRIKNQDLEILLQAFQQLMELGNQIL